MSLRWLVVVFLFWALFFRCAHGRTLYFPYDDNMPVLYKESFDLFGEDRKQIDFQVRKRPESLTTLLEAARSSFNKKDLPESERLYRKILGIDPKHTEAKTALASIMNLQSRNNEAMAMIEGLYQDLPASVDLKRATRRIVRRFDAKVTGQGYVYDDNTGCQKNYFRLGYLAPSVYTEKLAVEAYGGRFALNDSLGNNQSSEVGGVVRYYLTDNLLMKGDLKGRQFSGQSGRKEFAFGLDGHFQNFNLVSLFGSELLEDSFLAILNELESDYVFCSLGGTLHPLLTVEQTLRQDRINDGNIRREFNTLVNYILNHDGVPLVELRASAQFMNHKTEIALIPPLSSYFSSRDYSRYGFAVNYQRFYKKKIRYTLTPEMIYVKYKKGTLERKFLRGGGRVEANYQFNTNSSLYGFFESTIRENDNVRLLNVAYNYDF